MTELNGLLVVAKYELVDTFNWVDPDTKLPKPIMSFKVLLAHGDGTITRESISLPPLYKTPALTPGELYGFPVLVRYNKKRGFITYTARADQMPIPVARLQDQLGLER